MPRLPLLLGAGAVLALGTLAVRAQPARPATHAHAAPADSLTAKARVQLEAARRATAALATPEAARAAGYRPMFGHVPLQGEHYVRVDRVLAGGFDVAQPSVLMFAPVAGTPTLVGVAYAFLHPTDAPTPAGFDGAGDAWHAHERLAPMPGKHLVMMHAWFVDAPEGPFARYNPWLPYLATGLTPPGAATLADSAAGERARRLGLALAGATTPPLLFEYVARQGGDSLRAQVAPHRDAITALVPRLAAAERTGDRAAHARLVDEAIRHGDALVAAYRDAVPARPLVRRLVDRTVEEFLGRGHGIEEELGALFGGRAGGAAPTSPPAHSRHP
ncbi:MAG: hypothetical protein ACXWZ4_12950 [Gemmatirosa sp.]